MEGNRNSVVWLPNGQQYFWKHCYGLLLVWISSFWLFLDGFMSPHLVLKPENSGISRSISWMLMPWLLASPGHQQPWYCPCRANESLFSTRNVFNYLWWWEMIENANICLCSLKQSLCHKSEDEWINYVLKVFNKALLWSLLTISAILRPILYLVVQVNLVMAIFHTFIHEECLCTQSMYTYFSVSKFTN